MNNTLSRVSGSVLLSFLFTSSILPVTAADEALEQQPMVVTASRIAEPLNKALASVTLIDEESIRRSAAEDLLDLLRLEPGVDVVRSGPAGAQTSVFLRGTNSNHALVLIDGVRVASVNTGAYTWENLPLSQISRVEIVRGARASVYGSDAIGGVVQIFTRRDTTPNLRMTAGSFGSWEVAGGMGFQGESSQLNISIGHRNSDGFSAQNPNGFSFDPDDDGFENSNIRLNGTLAMAGGELYLSALGTSSDADFDQGVSESRQASAALGFRTDSDDDWQQQIQLGMNRQTLDSDFGFFQSEFESQRLDLAWHHQVRLSDQFRLLAGLEAYNEKGNNPPSYDQDRRNNAVYSAIRWGSQRSDLEASVRLDDNSEFGSETTAQIGWGFDLTSTLRLQGNLGNGFRAPNLNEQFSPGFGGLFAGNPNLKPEDSASLELGLRWEATDSQSLSLQVYDTRIENLIAFSGADFQAVNINRADIQGLEFQWESISQRWNRSINLTLQDTKDKNTGNRLLRRPDEKAAIVVDRLFSNGAWIGGELFWSGDRDDFAGPLGSYTLLNARGGWPIQERISLELRLDNLLDEDYEPALGFNGMGRAAFLSLHWQP